MTCQIDRSLCTVTHSDSVRNRHVCLAYKAHVERWNKCQECDLHTPVKIYCRGTLPCEVAFVGEAPGFDEYRELYPFVGVAGEILQAAINNVYTDFDFTYAITNTVICLPTTKLPNGQLELRKPVSKHVKACSKRLENFLPIMEPKVVILLGRTAQSKPVREIVTRFLEQRKSNPRKPIPVVETAHPAYIARRGGIGSADYVRLVMHITKAVESVL